jgi:Wzt-like putative exopolysaccharide export protein
VEIADVAIEGERGTRDTAIPGEPLVITVDVRAESAVPDLEVSFEVVAAATNRPVLGGRTSALGASVGAVDGKKRIRFRVPAAPWQPGRYFVTIGLESPAGEAYHIRTQHYPLTVPEVDVEPGPLEVRPEVEIEEL